MSQHPKNGMIYAATASGLLEFDGYESKIYEIPQKNGLRAVIIDSSGTIFTGGFEEFGYWKSNENCILEYYSLSDLVSIPKNDEIWKIVILDTAVIYQSHYHLYIYQGKSITTISTPGEITYLFDIQGNLATYALNDELYILSKNKFNAIQGSNIFHDKKVLSIIPYDSLTWLICTEKNGIYKYNNKGFTEWETEISRYLKLNNCNTALYIDDSSFVFGTILNGIVFSNNKGTIEKIYNYASGLNNNTVLSLTETKNKGILVGLDEGANYFEAKPLIDYFYTQSGELGTTYSILRDKEKLYLGSNHGLFVADISQTGKTYQFENLKMIPHSQGQVWILKKINNDILCGHNEGTFIVKDRHIQKISDIAGGWAIQQKDNYIIEGTYTGLIVFNKNKAGKLAFRNKIAGFNEPARQIAIDYLGYIWVTHPKKGVYRLEINDEIDSVLMQNEYSDAFNFLQNINVYQLNNRIVFASNQKFYTYDYINDKIIPFSVLNNSLSTFKESQQIIHYKNNQYWFINNNKIGLFQISIDFKATKIEEFIFKDTFVSERYLDIIPIENNNFIISNRKGFCLFNNSRLESQKIKTSINLTHIELYGKKERLSFCFSDSNICVPYHAKNLTVRFVDPNLSAKYHKVYLYRIKEVENFWHKTIENEVNYLNLKPGEYELEIKSPQFDYSTSRSFLIKKPWFNTTIAWLSYIFLFIIIVISIYYLLKNELRKQKKILEFEIRETKLENELQGKNMEIMLSLRYLIKKNNTLNELMELVESYRKETNNYPIKFFKKIDKLITHGLEMQTKEYKTALGNLKLSQQGYFKKLKEHFPNLTPNDIRICSYLRMNFNTKEIANLLNISVRSVEISRYRLRKKLELSHNENLTEFLMKGEFNSNQDNTSE